MYQRLIFVGPLGKIVRIWPAWYRPRWRITLGSTSFIEMRMEDNSTIKEKSLHPVEPVTRPLVAEPADANVNESDAEPIDERIMLALRSASDKKALDLVLIDLREIA